MNAGPGNRKPISNRALVASLTQWQFANAVTLDPGSQATVTNLGTSTAPVLEFGIPAGQSGEATGNVTFTGNVTVENLTVDGLLLSGKRDIVTGFAGGPRVSQAGWDTPGNAHTLAWTDLAEGSDNVTGFLYVHVSSKSVARKNGIATLTVVKSQGVAPDLMLTAVHMSPSLQVFDVGLRGNDVIVETDPGCSVCWSFVSAT